MLRQLSCAQDSLFDVCNLGFSALFLLMKKTEYTTKIFNDFKGVVCEDVSTLSLYHVIAKFFFFRAIFALLKTLFLVWEKGMGMQIY